MRTTSMSRLIFRSYNELIQLPTFEERFRYLALVGQVSEVTFGFERYLNQLLYRSSKWKEVRDACILRDDGNDLATDGYPIGDHIIVHHMNPITAEMIEDRDPAIFDLNQLVCVSHQTHNAIHFGDFDQVPKSFVERKPNDTCPWRQ